MMSRVSCESGCAWQPLPGVFQTRDEPWTTDRTGISFYGCTQCGALACQRYDESTGSGQMSVLSADASVLFRERVPVMEVLNYVMSQDFARNEVVTQGLFWSWIRATENHTQTLNALIEMAGSAARIDAMEPPLICMIQVLSELARRARQGEAPRCPIGGVTPLADLVRGILRIGPDPSIAGRVRSHAMQILEALGEPYMWHAVDSVDAEIIEEMIDHKSMLERAREHLIEARKLMHSDGASIVACELRFLLDVLRKREANVPDTLASLLWGCLRDIRSQLDNRRSRRELLEMAYKHVQLVLEHQLLCDGMKREPTLDRRSRAFIDPTVKIVVQLHSLEPRVSIFREPGAMEPIAVFHSWHDVGVFLHRVRSRRPG